LLVLNGIDTATNGHEQGTRHIWSGNLSTGHPSFGALVAGVKAPFLPMSYVSNGGYDFTADLVAATRVTNTWVLSRIAYPNRYDPNNPTSNHHTLETYDRIRHWREERVQRQLTKAKLPRVRRALNALYLSRTGDNDLKRLTEYLPATLDNSNNALLRQAQIICASFKAGLSLSANMSIGGFDTHGNHDAAHAPGLQRILAGVDFLMEEAERQGVADRLVVAVGSDFARTPWYNDTNGKDHWSITSMMMMGPGIRGGRVIGATDER